MAYLSKKTVLKAYEILSSIDEDKNQGLTQKVSALKYGAALDMFFKIYHKNCNLKLTKDKEFFSLCVGEIVKINDFYNTKDFYLKISENGRDFDCGSNFYSQSSVKDSKTNPIVTFKYPKRSGWEPVLEVKNEELLYDINILTKGLLFYLDTVDLQLAFVLWLLRFKEIKDESFEGVRESLKNIFTKDFCDALFVSEIGFDNCNYIEYSEEICILEKDDFLTIFSEQNTINLDLVNIADISNKTIEEEYIEFLKITTPKSVSNYSSSSFGRIGRTLKSIFKTDKDVSIYSYTTVEAVKQIIDILQSNREFLEYNETGRRQYSTALDWYVKFLTLRSMFSNIRDMQVKNNQDLSDKPLQQIYYGAPGTGKSHKTNKIVSEYSDTIRTTFHPDSDYSTFVGAYKPTTEKEYMYGLNGNMTVLFEDPITKKPLQTSKIEYKFVKQAFLKAYIKAWQKMCAVAVNFVPLNFNVGNDKFTITSVEGEIVKYTKESPLEREVIRKTWDCLWESGKFVIPTGPQSGQSVQQAVSQWIYDNIESCTQGDFDNGWNKIIDKLQKGEDVIVQKNVSGAQQYKLSLCGDTTDIVLVLSEKNKNRNRIKECYENNKKSVGVEYGIVECLEKYGCSNFDEAWDRLVEDVKRSSSIVKDSVIAPQFLVIEEINRGNCAQIFGDIFQLLDRKEGYSEYPIEADDDIRKALIEDNPTDGLSFGSEGLQLSEDVKHQINKICGDDEVADKVCNGEVLLLPPNLYIWATMNTSDQSLFPIDSAFKRRWDWKYMPISKGVDKDGNEMNWSIVIGKKSYDWWEFLTAINEVIGTETQSEDKKLGFFFCKADANDEISADKFVNKVLFYLWNDVFKTCGVEYHYKDGDDEKLLTFDKFHTKDGFDVDKIQNWLEKDLVLDVISIKETREEEEIVGDVKKLTEFKSLRKEYWTKFLKYAREESSAKEDYNRYFGGRKTPSTDKWYSFYFGAKDCHLVVEQTRSSNELYMGLYFDKMTDDFYKLVNNKEAIEQELDISFEWDELPGKKLGYIREVTANVDFNDSTDYKRQFDFIIDRLLRMRKVFSKYLG